MKFLAILMATIALSVLPVSALESAVDAQQTLAQKHPIFTAPVVLPTKAVKKIGKWTRLNRLMAKAGTVIKKTGQAASDSFVAFGEKTEKFQPGLQRCCSVSQIAYPFIMGFIRK